MGTPAKAYSQTRLFSPAKREPERFTFLSYGAGQDSTAILWKLLYDPAFRQTYAPGRLIVICSDTGNEHRPTLYHLVRTRRLCRQFGIEFFFVTKSWGFHTNAWRSLPEFYAAGDRIGSKSYPKACTVNLKINVAYKFLTHYLAEHYGVSGYKKNGLYEYTALVGEKIQVLIGIAADEAKDRIDHSERVPSWMANNIQRRYPLADLGWNRADCQNYIRSFGTEPPPPSLCVMCPFKTPEQVLLTAIENPSAYAFWVRLEANKLAAHEKRFPHLPQEKNHGVFGSGKTLPGVVEDTRRKYGHLSEQELEELLHENRMNHGHCVGSKY